MVSIKTNVTVLSNVGESLLRSGADGREAVGELLAELEQEGVVLPPPVMGLAGEYYYAVGNFSEAERCLNDADASCGAENRFAIYRSIYRALLHYEENPSHYVKLLNNAAFFLHEHKEPLPYLTESDAVRLESIRSTQQGRERKLLVRTLGGFSVCAEEDGRELPWRTRKGRELFAYLVEREGEPVDRSRLIEVLWDEEVPKNAVALLHNMIYNMRKELSAYGLERIVVYEKRRYRVSMDAIDADVVRLHEIMRAVKNADLGVLHRERGFFLSYGGAYLKDVDSRWADACRNAVDEAYRAGCGLLAEDAVREGDYEMAVTLYDNVLSVFPYEEGAVARLLELYAKQRRWGKREECYKAFAARLEEDLGVTPSEEVLVAYRRKAAMAG